MKLKSKRFCAGCYGVTINDREFTIERMSAVSDENIHCNDHTWMLCEQFDRVSKDGYMNHYRTKRDALDALSRYLD